MYVFQCIRDICVSLNHHKLGSCEKTYDANETTKVMNKNQPARCVRIVNLYTPNVLHHH